jgi:hypothetical protein
MSTITTQVGRGIFKMIARADRETDLIVVMLFVRTAADGCILHSRLWDRDLTDSERRRLEPCVPQKIRPHCAHEASTAARVFWGIACV